ncbi:14 kDa phosphohistidine phosphatase [Halotydeus destructor]|nr:14 kDa phosphohistidine phosphatase [Halotydeus destructor]
MDSLEAADIDTGKFKYVLIKVTQGERERHLVRGYKVAEYHADVLEGVEEKELNPIKKQFGDVTWECVGGGRILHDANHKWINVYGYSMAFGKPDHSITCDILKQKYPDYGSIQWSDEGY